MKVAVKMTTVSYGIFASICFSAAVATEKSVPASERVKACDGQIALAAAEEIIGSADPLKEQGRLHLNFAAGVLFDHGRKDEAVFWNWVARTGFWYDFPFPSSGLDFMLANMRRPNSAGPISNYALQDTRRFERILARVQERYRNMQNPVPQKQERVYRILDDLRAKIAAQREEIEQQAPMVETQLEYRRASISAGPRCLRVLIHPSDAPRMIADESALVVEFVKNQPDVINAVGAVKGASPLTFTIPQDHVLPSRYEVRVRGDDVGFAIVDVSRDVSRAQFKLVCVARKSFSNRDVLKDPCKQ